MKAVELQRKISEEEFFSFEEQSEERHELIDGNISEMSSVSIYHKIVRKLIIMLDGFLKSTDWELVFESFRIKTPDGNIFNPDIAVCHPQIEKYYSTKPILIIEVLSNETRKYNLTEKFLQYRKIDTLHYYLCIEPEQQVVIFYFRQEDGEWAAETFTQDEQSVVFPKLNISFTIKDIYHR